tara:strand:+ start:1926 stop:2888 length:963 start_codon:yes stop_codon:yes gene_type:complete
MKNKKYSVLIIGLGQIGLKYDLNSKSKNILTHSKAVTKHPSFNLIGAVDLDNNNRNFFKKNYNLPAFTTVKESLLVLKPDVITVAVSTKNHFKIIKEILKFSKTKTILVEKPFCDSYQKSLLISKMCKLNKVDIFVNYGRHCLPGVNKIKLMIKKKTINIPMKGNVWFSRGYFNNGSHFIELLQHLLGPIKNIYKIQNKKIQKNKFLDFSVAYKNGFINFIENVNKKFSHQSIELLSRNNRIYWSHTEDLYIQDFVKNVDYPKYNIIEKSLKKINLGNHKIQWHVYDQLANFINNKSSNICGVESALKVCKALSKLKKLV